MRDALEEQGGRKADKERLGAQQLQRPYGIGHAPTKRRATLARQRFRKHEEAVKRVGEAQTRSDPERQPQVDAAQETADGRTDDEAEAERGAHYAELRRPLVGGRDVGDVRAAPRALVVGRDPDSTSPRTATTAMAPGPTT